MMTLDDLCAHLLPPDDRIKFQSLIIDEPRFILVAAMISANSTCPIAANRPLGYPRGTTSSSRK